MATDLVTIENNILGRLQPVATQYNVGLGRLDANELNRPVTASQLFVDYNGFTVQYPLTSNRQELRTYSYRVYLRLLNLQTHDQAYPVLSAVSRRLKDFKPNPILVVRGLQLISEKPDLSKVADGLWVYVQNYDFQILEV